MARFALKGTVLCCTAMLAVAACSPDPAPGRIKLKWKLGFGVPCDDAEAGIDTVRVSVLEPGEAGREVVSDTFSCDRGEGTVENVPIGTYNLLVEGGVKADFKYAVFKATLGSVIIGEGETVDIGSMSLEKVPPSQNPGGLQVSWTFESGLCGANGVETVLLTVWRSRVYKEHEKPYPCDLPAPGHVQLDLPPGDYGVVAEGLDIEGVLVRRGTRDSVTVEQGDTASLVGSDAIVLEPL